jgi:hypothetical protein
VSALWVVALMVALVGATLLAVTLHRTRDEVAPTVEAFSRFRAALQPAVVELRDETGRTRARLAARRDEATGPRG